MRISPDEMLTRIEEALWAQDGDVKDLNRRSNGTLHVQMKGGDEFTITAILDKEGS